MNQIILITAPLEGNGIPQIWSNKSNTEITLPRQKRNGIIQSVNMYIES